MRFYSFSYIRSSLFFIPTVHEKATKKIRVSSLYPNQSEPMHNLFRVFALLNLRLHRRVKLLVLASSLLEFRVLVISCHAAAALSSSLLPFTTTACPPPIRIHIPSPIRIHIPPLVCIHIPPPLPYFSIIYSPPVRASPPIIYHLHQSEFHQIHLRHQS